MSSQRLWSAAGGKAAAGVPSLPPSQEQRDEWLRVIFDNAFQFIGLLTPEGMLLEANRAALQAVGVEAQEVIGKNFWDCPWWLHSQEEGERVRQAILQAADGQPVHFQTWFYALGGHRRDVDFSLTPVRNEAGQVIYLVPEGRDITEMVAGQKNQLKKDQWYLEQSELNQRRLQEAQRLAQIGHWEWDLETGQVDWSPELFRLFQLDPASTAPTYTEQEKFFTPASWQALAAASKEAVENGTGFELELEITLPGRDSRWFIARAEPIRDETGQVLRFFGTTQDITPQRQMMRKVEQISQRLQLATQAAELGIWDWYMDNDELLWDAQMHRIYEVPEDIGRLDSSIWRDRLHPDDWDATKESLNKALIGEQDFDTTFRILLPDGCTRYIQAKGIVQRDAEGRPLRMLGTNADVTERVMVEAGLHESEERFRHAFEYSAVGMALLEPDGTWMAVNKAVCDIVGYTEEELKKLRFQDITHPDDLAPDLANVARLIRGEVTHYQMEKRYLHKAGHVVWILLTASLVKEEDGSPAYFISQIEDITQRHEAELVLKYQRQQLSLLIEHTPAAVAMFDREMRYVAASRRWLEDYHLQSQPLLGRSHYDVFPEINEEWKAIHRRCLAGATEQREEDMFVRSDGQVEWLRWEVRPWMEVNGEIGGIVMFTEVITERKHAAEKIQTSLEEKEVLLREIHHRVKNNMQIISSLLQLQTSALHDPADVAIFQDCQTRIHAMAMVHDRLYRSGNLSTINFGEHLRELATLLLRGQATGGCRISIQTDCDDLELDLDKAIPLGLIATELITNAFKHAFKGREEGSLTILLQKQADGQLLLRVLDDGHGLPKGTDPVSARTLGLRLVRSLGHQLRAKIIFLPQEAGSCVEVCFAV